MILHVANGSATTRLIEASGLPGRTLSWADSLHDGPVPDVSDEELVRIRAVFHASPEHPLEANIEGFTGWQPFNCARHSRTFTRVNGRIT